MLLLRVCRQQNLSRRFLVLGQLSQTHPASLFGAAEWPETSAQSLIGLIGYSYQQVTTSFSEAGLQRTPRLSVLGPKKFGDGVTDREVLPGCARVRTKCAEKTGVGL